MKSITSTEIKILIQKAQEARKINKKGVPYYKKEFPEEQPINVHEQKNLKRDLYKSLFKTEFPEIKVKNRDNFSEVKLFSTIMEKSKLPKLSHIFEELQGVIERQLKNMMKNQQKKILKQH